MGETKPSTYSHYIDSFFHQQPKMIRDRDYKKKKKKNENSLGHSSKLPISKSFSEMVKNWVPLTQPRSTKVLIVPSQQRDILDSHSEGNEQVVC